MSIFYGEVPIQWHYIIDVVLLFIFYNFTGLNFLRFLPFPLTWKIDHSVCLSQIGQWLQNGWSWNETDWNLAPLGTSDSLYKSSMFDPLVLKVILESFCALVSETPTQKRIVIEHKRSSFMTQRNTWFPVYAAPHTTIPLYSIPAYMVGVNQAYSRLSTTHGHITDCKLDSVVYGAVCVWVNVDLSCLGRTIYAQQFLGAKPPI